MPEWNRHIIHTKSPARTQQYCSSAIATRSTSGSKSKAVTDELSVSLNSLSSALAASSAMTKSFVNSGVKLLLLPPLLGSLTSSPKPPALKCAAQANDLDDEGDDTRRFRRRFFERRPPFDNCQAVVAGGTEASTASEQEQATTSGVRVLKLWCVDSARRGRCRSQKGDALARERCCRAVKMKAGWWWPKRLAKTTGCAFSCGW